MTITEALEIAKAAPLNPARPPVTCLPYAEAAVGAIVATAIGAGSACWKRLDHAGIFDSDRAIEITDAAVAALLEATSLGKPALGCATNAELRAELEARTRLGHTADDYRTAGA